VTIKAGLVDTGQLSVESKSGSHAEVIFRYTAPGNVVVAMPDATACVKHYP